MCARLERRGRVRNSPSIWLCRATCQSPLLGAGLSQGTVLPTVGKPGPGDIHNRPSVHDSMVTIKKRAKMLKHSTYLNYHQPYPPYLVFARHVVPGRYGTVHETAPRKLGPNSRQLQLPFHYRSCLTYRHLATVEQLLCQSLSLAGRAEQAAHDSDISLTYHLIDSAPA